MRSFYVAYFRGKRSELIQAHNFVDLFNRLKASDTLNNTNYTEQVIEVKLSDMLKLKKGK